MSSNSITSSLLSQIAGSDTAAHQFVTDLNQLAKDIQSGNLSAAQQDYVTLSQDALNGVTSLSSTTSSSGITTGLLSNIVSSSTGLSSFVGELNQLGTDLENGNLSSAQQDMLGLDATALQSVSSAGTGVTSSTAGTVTPTNQAEANALIQAIVKAMSEGDDSAVSSGLSELASISQSFAGAGILQSESRNYGSNTSSSSSSSSVEQLLQQLNS